MEVSFQVIYVVLELEIQITELKLSLHYFVQQHEEQPANLMIFATFPKCLKVTHTATQLLASYKCLIGSIRCRHSAYLCH